MNARLPHASTILALLVPLALAGSGTEAGQEPVAPGLRFIWSHPVIEGESDTAQDLTLRVQSYLQANHRLASMFPLRDYGVEPTRVTWVISFASTMEMEMTMGALEGEEGWLALEELQAGVFDLKQESVHFMLPVFQRSPPGQPMRFWLRRSARAAPTDLSRAIRFARAEAEYVNANYPAARMEVYAGVERDLGWIFWFCEFGSSDLWRDIQTQLWADDEYLELMEKASGLFDAASWTEKIDMTFN